MRPQCHVQESGHDHEVLGVREGISASGWSWVGVFKNSWEQQCQGQALHVEPCRSLIWKQSRCGPSSPIRAFPLLDHSLPSTVHSVRFQGQAPTKPEPQLLKVWIEIKSESSTSELDNFSCKGSGSKYFMPSGPYSLPCNN